jgi:gamma-glutamyltranspeptidase / glutathione hydrolase
MVCRTLLAGSCLLAVALALACGPTRPRELAGPGRSAAPSAAKPRPNGSAHAAPRIERRMPTGRAEPPRVALGTQGAVATQQALATDVGLAVLQAGGNAVDAAVAVGFALAVTHPAAGNLGGGGFMVVRTGAGELAALDFREAAPSEARPDMYLDAKANPTVDSLRGPKAAGIPGSVAGLVAAHQRFGKAAWRELVLPAARLAREGFELDPVEAEEIAEVVPKMRAAGFTATAKLYTRADGTTLRAGERLVQGELGATLEAIAEQGPRVFYEGPMAETMAGEVRKAGGIWRAEDLARYQAKWRDPLVLSYRGYQVVTMPPPSSGGVVLGELLAASEILGMERKPWRGADEIHLFAEAARRAYADRNELLGDPDFVHNPVTELLNRAYVARRVSDIEPDKATPSSAVRAGLEPPKESPNTTHYSVVDSQGTAVATTTTLNSSFGSLYAVPGLGVLLNDEMDDFSVKPGSPNAYGLVQGRTNRIEPGKRMLSSMTPTILVHEGDVRAVLGTPGGPTISTTVAQLVRAVVDYGRPLDEAVPAFRAHHQWLPDEIVAESTMPPDVQAELTRRGHAVRRRVQMGHANCIETDPATHGFRAVADTTRGGGKAAAY